VSVHRFTAMGCEVAAGGATASERAAVEALFRHYDAVFSRFRPDSELNAVNAAAGRVVSVSPLFARALRVALDAAAATHGLVDPTLGAQLAAAGYDRDFARLDATGPPVFTNASGERWRSIRLQGRLVRAPAGVRLDLNGVVKSLAVDDALALLGGPGWVGAGGDLATRRPLTVGLPRGGSVALLAGGLATSGSARRAWSRGGVRVHHLIDPRTGRPAAVPWEQVTVCGAGCLGADVAAKAAFLAGPDWLDERGLPGRFVGRDGSIHETEAWRRWLGVAA
jgi:thiamine biosynthesis lipoprotein